MPSIAAHMSVAKLVGDKLNIKDDDFIRGNLLPDVTNKKDSHNRTKGSYFLVPNIKLIKESYDLKNNLYLGSYVHLLLDYYYLEEFLPKYVTKKTELFDSKELYKEYDRMNKLLLNDFKIDINKITKILSKFDKNIINEKKLKYNLECLNKVDNNELEYIKIKDFEDFLINISDRIANEIEEINK